MPAWRTRTAVAFACGLAALTLGACSLLGTAGSGRVLSETVTADAFTALEVGSSFEVTVRPGQPHRVVVEADDNLWDLLAVDVRGDVLRVRLRPGASVRDATLRADVTMPELRALDSSGASRVTIGEAFHGEVIELVASGASRLAGPLTAERLDVDASGASTVQLSGRATEVAADASGASSLELDDLEIGTLRVELSGASDASVTVREVIDASLSGASNLRYAGDAVVERSETSGASSIRRR